MSVVRAAWLSAQNEVRLLTRDPVVLLMLLLAPVVIIMVAGYSLGAIYGTGAPARAIPLVDRDGGEVATAVVGALRDARVAVELVPDADHARRLVNRADGPPLAIEIPAGTTSAVAGGREVRLVLYVDPAKRIEADALELRLGELCRRVGDDARKRAQHEIDAMDDRLRRQVADVERAIERERARMREALERARVSSTHEVRRQVAAALERARRDVEALVRTREETAWAGLASQLAARQAVLERLRSRLDELAASQRAFADWLARVRELAGTHAADLPPPPAFPPLPAPADLAELARPVERPEPAALPRDVVASRGPAIALPPLELPEPSIDLAPLRDARLAPLPGSLAFEERAASAGADVNANAFDEYVPGFGITFLLIGMMLGIALTLSDEREWGTLQRLRAGGAPLTGVLLGKMLARFVVGVVQMVVLFAVGRALFGISLGRQPAALLLPTVGISFAAAALGLLMPSIARAHDSVMPLGTMTSMAMSAIGGCWWPLGFEPAWMQTLARALPTTWAMQAYNDLMIRRAPASAALRPFAATVALGFVFLAIGLYRHLRQDG